MRNLADVYRLWGNMQRPATAETPPAPRAAGGGQPPPGLSMADLYTPLQMPQYPDAPTLPSGIQDLDPETARRVRQQQLLAVLGQGLAAYDTGRMGTALLQGVLGAGQFEDEAVARARADAEDRYRMQMAGAQREAQGLDIAATNQQNQARAQAALQAYNQIAQVAGADAPDLVRQAEAAARAGDLAALQKIVQAAPERVAFARSMRERGVDPNDPVAVRQFEQERDLEARVRQEEAVTRARETVRSQFEKPPAPERPREGALTYDAQGNAYIVDQATGRSRPVTLPGGGQLNRGEGQGSGDRLWNRAVQEALRIDARRQQNGEAPMTADQKRATAQEVFGLLQQQGQAAPGGGQPQAQASAVESAIGRRLTQQEQADVAEAIAAGYSLDRIVALLRADSAPPTLRRTNRGGS